MDQDRLIITLEGYGAKPCMCSLLETFWECQQVMPRQNGFQGTAFPATRGTNQGGLLYPTLFNVVVDKIIRTWLSMMLEYQRVDHDGLGDTVWWCLEVFYSENGMVGSCNLDWLQHTMNFLVGLFRRYGLDSNVAKSRTMTCQPGAL